MIMETPVVVIDPTDIGLMVGWSFDHSNHFRFWAILIQVNHWYTDINNRASNLTESK